MPNALRTYPIIGSTLPVEEVATHPTVRGLSAVPLFYETPYRFFGFHKLLTAVQCVLNSFCKFFAAGRIRLSVRLFPFFVHKYRLLSLLFGGHITHNSYT